MTLAVPVDVPESSDKLAFLIQMHARADFSADRMDASSAALEAGTAAVFEQIVRDGLPDVLRDLLNFVRSEQMRSSGCVLDDDRKLLNAGLQG